MSNPATDDPVAAIYQWLAAGRRSAIATVVKTWGSAPRPPGSQLATREDGAFVGSVSGGCVEAAVIEESLSAIRDRQIRKLEFGVSNEQAWAMGLACGGQIEVFIEPVL